MSSNEDNKGSPKRATTNFSIEHILKKPEKQSSNSDFTNVNNYHEAQFDLSNYSWMNCTRYCPPKISRVQKRFAPQKRQLGRHPRIPFSSHQLSVLEEKYKQSAYLSSEEVNYLSQQLDLAAIRVKIWFQNRRARDRKERLTSRMKPSPSTVNNPTIMSFSDLTVNYLKMPHEIVQTSTSPNNDN